MNKQSTILYVDDDLIKSNKAAHEFVKDSRDSFCPMLLDEKLYFIIKKITDKKQTTEEIRMLSGSIAREAKRRKLENVHVEDQSLSNAMNKLTQDSFMTAFVEGWHLGAYQFENYLSKKGAHTPSLTFHSQKECQAAIDLGEKRAQATAFSRDLMNEVPNVLTPETFPELLKKEFASTAVEVTVHQKKQLEDMEMNGVLTVGKGSIHEPAFVELAYHKDPSKPLVALVGKGVTFDTGGISLKRGRDLSDMRMDMGGAAAVSGAMKLLKSIDADVNVTALLPIVENMPDRKSLIPGEVITYKNGKTVQVGNTDAEGRLILADALIRAEELKADYIVDIATLTGAVVNALGSKLAGVFGDDSLASSIKAIGDENGDWNWTMPLVEAYDSYLTSDYADFSNISNKGEAGAITAALFLKRFISDESKWLHIDMAGVMDGKQAGYYAKGATGYGARLLADFTISVS